MKRKQERRKYAEMEKGMQKWKRVGVGNFEKFPPLVKSWGFVPAEVYSFNTNLFFRLF